ncbi:hypothetical protein [Streptomyces sp. 7-21]|uniref:hypothetical protein n=1 Tax=Streptomyces sp. 7-21 TaxID=2802283 RepID=UPI0019200A9C|nr:hypothetical protein [Streptomyces sp. 7-21]MBL1067129.1 hypothetical protein [Streptomyces sp. 7-21]
MLVAAAVCPCPPVLVPEVAQGAASELDGLRAACREALRAVAAARPGLLLVVAPAGPGEEGHYPGGSRGSLRGFGVDVDAVLAPVRQDGGDPPGGTAGAGEATGRALPPALTVAAWLLRHASWDAAPVEGLAVGETLEPERCAATGRELAGRAPRVALLAMGDGSACRSARAPGAYDARAAGFDAAAARALAAADTAALAATDPALATALHAAGRPVWQVLAGAASGAGLDGRLLYDDAPYGVGYFVARWT